MEEVGTPLDRWFDRNPVELTDEELRELIAFERARRKQQGQRR